MLILTCVILPNRVADDDRRRCGAIPAAPLAFNVRWSSKRSVDALDNQYANTSLLSWVWNPNCSNMSKEATSEQEKKKVINVNANM